MDAPHTPASAERRAFSVDDFHAWLDGDQTPALIVEDHDRFYAYCLHFGIAGTGETEEQAVSDARSLLVNYLIVSYVEGCSFEQSKKQAPLSMRLRSTYLGIRSKLRGMSAPLSRMGGLISIPTDDAAAHSARPLAN